MKTYRLFLAASFLLAAQNAALGQGGELALGRGDRITISIGAIPDNEVAQIKGVYTISDGGTVNLLHIGEVRAAGLKPSALQKVIEQTYIAREIYTRPNVLVTTDSVGGETMRQIYVTGVNKPGAVPYQQDLTLSRAIQAAGGPTAFGNMRKVKLIRAGQQPTMHDLTRGTGNPAVDVLVKPNDQIIVPE